MPCASRSHDVAKRSSPSSCTSGPSSSVASRQRVPVVLAQRILDRDERIAARPARELARQRRRRRGAGPRARAGSRRRRRAAWPRRRARAPRRRPARSMPRRRDLERLLVGGERRGEPALVGHERRGVAALAQLGGGAGAHAARRARSPRANVVRGERDHEHVLHVDGAPGVRAAREHVDHRPRQQRRGAGASSRQSGVRAASAAASAQATEAASTAFAPSRASAGVPSRSRSAASIDGLLGGVAPAQAARRSRR